MKKFSLVLLAFMLIICSGFTAVSNAEGQETLVDVLGKSSSGDEKTKVLLDYENYSFIGDAEKQDDTKEIFKSLPSPSTFFNSTKSTSVSETLQSFSKAE